MKNARRGNAEYRRQQAARPTQEPLIKEHLARANAASSEFEADAHRADALATARLDNTSRQLNRGGRRFAYSDGGKVIGRKGNGKSK